MGWENDQTINPLTALPYTNVSDFVPIKKRMRAPKAGTRVAAYGYSGRRFTGYVEGHWMLGQRPGRTSLVERLFVHVRIDDDPDYWPIFSGRISFHPWQLRKLVDEVGLMSAAERRLHLGATALQGTRVIAYYPSSPPQRLGEATIIGRSLYRPKSPFYYVQFDEKPVVTAPDGRRYRLQNPTVLHKDFLKKVVNGSTQLVQSPSTDSATAT